MLDELNIFVHAVEAASFTGAAKQLQISQPAVSMQVHNLEKRLNSVLFDRGGRTANPTEAADALLPLAREILQSATLIKEMMASMQSELIGNLRIACSTSTGKYVLPRLIARFRRQHPKVRATVGVCTPDSAVSQVCDGSVHMGILSNELQGRGLECRLLMEDRVILIVPADHPWKDRKCIKTQELADQPFILREETSATRQVVESGLLDHRIRVGDLRVVTELGSEESVVKSVEVGIGVAFISRVVAQCCIKPGRVVEVPVEGLDLGRQLYMIRHNCSSNSRILAAFWALFEGPGKSESRVRSTLFPGDAL